MTNVCTFVTKNPCIVTPKCSIICHSDDFPSRLSFASVTRTSVLTSMFPFIGFSHVSILVY